MTSKDKYAKKAATEIRRNGHTIRTNRYLAFKKGWAEKLSRGDTDVWDKSEADHLRLMVDACSGKKESDEEFRRLYLEAVKKSPNTRMTAAEIALFKAEGLI